MIELYANAPRRLLFAVDEDYGYVTLEGMLSGKPVVVASDGGSATEFIEHKREGLIVEPEATRARRVAVDSLYADRARAQDMGAHGLEKLKAMNLMATRRRKPHQRRCLNSQAICWDRGRPACKRSTQA